MLKFLTLLMFSSIMNLTAQNLKSHQWKNRVIIVKTVDKNSKEFQEQRKAFRHSEDELMDRKIVLYEVIGDAIALVDLKSNILNTKGKRSKKLADKLFNKKETFEVILIGLDGGVKLQQTEPLTKEALFGIIDSMPMRQSEIHRNKTKN